MLITRSIPGAHCLVIGVVLPASRELRQRHSIDVLRTSRHRGLERNTAKVRTTWSIRRRDAHPREIPQRGRNVNGLGEGPCYATSTTFEPRCAEEQGDARPSFVVRHLAPNVVFAKVPAVICEEVSKEASE